MPERIIRLNGNENPYGPSPQVAPALSRFQDYNRYPDSEQRRLRAALSDYVGAPPEQIVAGNGSDEIIDLLLRMFLGPGDNAIIPTPTFGMYSFNAEMCGGEAIAVPRDANFEIDVEEVALAANAQTKLIFIASPNNPTGNIATEAQIRALLAMGKMVVVDEAYYEFCGLTAIPLLREYPNLVVLRTFSKWAGLAGLRVGLGVMQADIAGLMMQMKPPYNVNLAAEVAVAASLDSRGILIERVNTIVEERNRLISALRQIKGLKPFPSQANFVWCRVPRGRGKEIFEDLGRRGIFLRFFSSYPDYIRASVGLPGENEALVEALRELGREN